MAFLYHTWYIICAYNSSCLLFMSVPTVIATTFNFVRVSIATLSVKIILSLSCDRKTRSVSYNVTSFGVYALITLDAETCVATERKYNFYTQVQRNCHATYIKVLYASTYVMLMYL